MALTPGAVGIGQSTAAAGEEAAFNGSIPGTTLCVRCRSASAFPAIVRVPPLHGGTANVGAVVMPGEREYFRVGHQDIPSTVMIGGDGGAATVDWYLVARTRG